MLTAIIILSLISLLVATEAEPGGAQPEGAHEDPLRPGSGKAAPAGGDDKERLAA